ncbi:MAG: DMT family transporter [Pseudomonadota bacterium]|nr:DMT family transporter [Pseudomonadota bacterium]
MNSSSSAVRLPVVALGGSGLATLGAILFSAKAIVVKLAYRYGVHAELMLALRMALAMPCFLAVLWWSSLRAGAQEPGLPGRRDLGLILLAGVLGYYAASLLDFMGLEYISAGLERLILFTYPPLVLLVSCGLHRRWPGARALLAMALSYTGLLLVYGHEARLEGAHVTLGALLVLGSALCYAAYLLVAGELLRRLGTLRVTSLATLVSGVIVLVQASLHTSRAELLALPAAVWWLSLFNALFCTVVPVFAVMMAIRRIGATRVAQIGMLGPVSTIAMGVLILGEPFTPWLLLGTGLVLAGIALLNTKRPD